MAGSIQPYTGASHAVLRRPRGALLQRLLIVRSERLLEDIAKLIAFAVPGALALPATATAEAPGSCGYRQASVSLPAIQVSSKEVGHPYRALYGYCLKGGERFVLHQDWALSYLDADPVGTFPGGSGAGVGTDLLLRWHPDWQPSLVPYLDAGAGIQFAAGTAFPADATRWNFTVHGGVGWLIPTKRDRQFNLSLRYLHISNGSIGDKNSGYDVVHFVLGMRWGRQQ